MAVIESNEIFVRKNLKRNFFVNVFDGAFFGFGMGFASLTAIVPLFVAQLTTSPILIGLIPAIHSMGWQLPQLLTAQKVSKLSKLKRHVLLMTIQERAPFLGLALVSLFLSRLNPVFALIIIFLLLIWQGLGAGITANGWQNLIGKVIPSENRGVFFGIQSAAANLLSSVGAVLAGILLDKSTGSSGFTICFLICVFFFMISWIFLSRTKEPVADHPVSEQVTKPLWQNVKEILKNDKPFLGFLISRMVYQIGMMGFAFYIIYWVKQVRIMNVAVAGVLTGVLMITTVAAGPLFGWLADKWNHKSVFVMGAVAAALSALIAWLRPTQGWSYAVMILAGISSTIFWSVGIAYTLDFGDDRSRPTYVGMINTLGAPVAVLAPFLGGLIAEIDYRITFIVSAIAAVITIVVLVIFIQPVNNKAIIKAE